jgi:hypothetical protein
MNEEDDEKDRGEGGYRCEVIYITHFEVLDEPWVVLTFAENVIEFEENNNEHPDCHMIGMTGTAERFDGRWKIDESSRRQIEMYYRRGMADAIEAFFDKHGPPREDEYRLWGLPDGSCTMDSASAIAQWAAEYSKAAQQKNELEKRLRKVEAELQQAYEKLRAAQARNAGSK